MHRLLDQLEAVWRGRIDRIPTSTMVVTLTARDGGGTLMAIESRFPSREAMDHLVSMGLEEGVTSALAQIDDILAEDAAT